MTSNTANSNNYEGIRLHSSWHNTLEDNTANSSGDNGIDFDNSSYNNIICNWVYNNTVASFYLTGGSTGNTIKNNNIIENGDLQGDGSYHWQLENYQSDDVDACDNWWGTNDETSISASIYDWNDDPSRGIVTYLPRLGQPAPCAPTAEEPPAFTAADAAIALEIAVGSRPFDDAADMNSDGRVTSLDALMILQAAGAIDSL